MRQLLLTLLTLVTPLLTQCGMTVTTTADSITITIPLNGPTSEELDDTPDDTTAAPDETAGDTAADVVTQVTPTK